MALPLLEGDDWERFCIEALELRHATDFQKVPARFRGDYGLDGYIRGTTLYQCYGDEAGASASERSRAQRRKLSTDIPKLKKYAEPISKLVGTGVGDYVFLVSLFEDKAVLETAEELASKVRGWNLGFLSPGFKISVKDRDFLRVEWEVLHGSLKQKLPLPDPSADQGDIDVWAGAHDALVETLTKKLEVIAMPGGIEHWRDRFIRDHLRELDALAKLRGNGSIWLRAREMKDERERLLESPRLTASPADDLKALCEGFRAEIQDEIRSMPYPYAVALAWGAAGDWLMRCPLDYARS